MNSLLNLPLVWLTYDLFAIAGMFMLAVVGSQADNDLQLKRWETINLRKARRLSFRTAVLFLGFTILAQGTFWEPSLIAAGNLIPGMLILAVNAASLNSRVPPNHENGFRLLQSVTEAIWPLKWVPRIRRNYDRHGIGYKTDKD